MVVNLLPPPPPPPPPSNPLPDLQTHGWLLLIQMIGSHLRPRCHFLLLRHSMPHPKVTAGENKTNEGALCELVGSRDAGLLPMHPLGQCCSMLLRQRPHLPTRLLNFVACLCPVISPGIKPVSVLFPGSCRLCLFLFRHLINWFNMLMLLKFCHRCWARLALESERLRGWL